MKLITLAIMVAVVPRSLADDSKKLDVSEERSIRSFVEGSGHTTTVPKGGKYANLEILVVPDGLSSLYAKKPIAVRRFLILIMEGANAKESAAAAAFAITLVSTNPVAGAGVVRLFNASKYDEIDKDWDETPRQHWIGKVKSKD